MPSQLKSFSELFEVRGGNGKLTRKYIRLRPGPHPVYGATVGIDKAIGHTSDADFMEDGLSFVRIGYAGHVAHREAPFSVTCNVFVLEPRGQYRGQLYLPYFATVISSALKPLAVGRQGKDGRHDYMQITKAAAQSAEIIVPVDEQGNPDWRAQVDLADRYDGIRNTKTQIAGILKSLGEIKLALPLDGVQSREVLLSDIFEQHSGKGKYTRDYARRNPGSFSLYTAATHGGDIDKIDTFDFDTEALHYTIQGANAGTVFHREHHKFSMTGDAGILIRKADLIDYRYAFHALAELFAKQEFRWARLRTH